MKKEFVNLLLKKIWNRKFLCFIAALFTAALFFGLFLFTSSYGLGRNTISLDKNWKITDSDSTYESINLSDYKIPSDIEPGGIITFEHLLGNDIPLRSTLKFRSYHSKVAVLVNGEILYRYGFDFEENELVGSGYHYVNLPEKISGKTLKIVFDVRESAAANTTVYVDILSDNAVSDYSARHSLSLCSGVFLGIFGVAMFCFGIFAMAYKKSFCRLILIGFFSSLMGVWTLCYTKTIQVFSMNFAMNTRLEYITLYLSAIVFELLLLNTYSGHLKKWKKVGLWICFAVGTLFFIVTSVLNALDIVHYSQTLLFFHLYILLSFIFVVAAKILFGHEVGLQEKIVAVGLGSFLLSAILDLLRYNLLKYIVFFGSFMSMTFLPIGTLILVFSLVASFLVYVYGMIRDMSEKKMLARLAYTDVLTGLFNRAKCEQIFEILDAGDFDYAVVSVDLNDLKKVNDAYGHSEGDRLISSFAEVFREAFSEIGTAIRMGGDEFVAVVRAEHLRELEDSLKKMVQLEKKHSVGLPVALDASYGFAVRNRNSRIIAYDVYRMADAKMYEMKVALKKARVNLG